MRIKVEKPTEELLEKLKVKNWPIWTKEISRFDWYYDQTEECYILEGKVVVETEAGEKVEVKAGDFVTFPRGLACTWDVQEPIRKHYNFRD